MNYVTGEEISEKIGIPKDKISTYSTEGYLYHRRYSITRQREFTTEPICERAKPLTAEVMRLFREWDVCRVKLNPKAKVS